MSRVKLRIVITDESIPRQLLSPREERNVRYAIPDVLGRYRVANCSQPLCHCQTLPCVVRKAQWIINFWGHFRTPIISLYFAYQIDIYYCVMIPDTFSDLY